MHAVAMDTARFWCNERFLDPATKPFDAIHLRVAKRGYLYALAAALALQKDNAEGRAHYFAAPARLRLIDRPRRLNSGFEVSSFELRKAPTDAKPSELVIAFAGSNDDTDWKSTNFGLDQRQYIEARRYVQKLARQPAYQGVRLVLAGYSLGGALAVHVTKHRDTAALVAETWAFNPSPKTWVSSSLDGRIWLAAVHDEALEFVRTAKLTLLPGVADIGAPREQRAEGFYLLSANPVYSHYRWVLTRNILHVADMALREDSGNAATTEPLEILRASHFTSCRPAP